MEVLLINYLHIVRHRRHLISDKVLKFCKSSHIHVVDYKNLLESVKLSVLMMSTLFSKLL